MLDHTKIMLSAAELDKVLDTSFFLTKHAVIDRVYIMFEALYKSIHETVQSDEVLSAIFDKSYPKISKGENYQLLPYVILDYPTLFTKTDAFALRTMFWWGNFFSVTLVLKGKYRVQFEDLILKNIQAELLSNIYICNGKDEWQHHFEPDNYELLNEKTASFIKEHAFIKLAIKYDLCEWNKMPELLLEGSKQLLHLLKN